MRSEAFISLGKSSLHLDTATNNCRMPSMADVKPQGISVIYWSHSYRSRDLYKSGRNHTSAVYSGPSFLILLSIETSPGPGKTL